MFCVCASVCLLVIDTSFLFEGCVMTFNTPLPIVSRIGVYMELTSMVQCLFQRMIQKGWRLKKYPAFLLHKNWPAEYFER